jgi:hypothetical protein
MQQLLVGFLKFPFQYAVYIYGTQNSGWILINGGLLANKPDA